MIVEGIFFSQTKTKYVPQCEQMVPVLMFLLCFIFITDNLRLAGGYHLPSAVDVLFIYFIFIRENTWGQEI